MAKQMKFTLGNAAAGYKTVEVFVKSDVVSYKVLRNGLLDVDKKSFSVGFSESRLAELDALNIFDWAEAYSSAARGGEQWELIFKDGDKIYRGRGSNAYPENWERFLDWLDALVPELEFVDRQRLEKITLDYSRESDGGIAERLTLDRRENILTLYKPQSMHLYRLGADIDKLFAAAQIVFDGLKADDFQRSYPAQIKIELIRHDGSIENFDALFNESSLPGFGKFVDVLKVFVTDLTAEILSPVPAVIAPAQGKYIFCKVQFKGSYKHYTYQTDDETLAVGDVVDVPVGKNNDVNQARIVEIGYFDEYEAPFPVDRIKKIIGKHVATEWDNY